MHGAVQKCRAQVLGAGAGCRCRAQGAGRRQGAGHRVQGAGAGRWCRALVQGAGAGRWCRLQRPQGSCDGASARSRCRALVQGAGPGCRGCRAHVMAQGAVRPERWRAGKGQGSVAEPRQVAGQSANNFPASIPSRHPAHTHTLSPSENHRNLSFDLVLGFGGSRIFSREDSQKPGPARKSGRGPPS
jgi:hypothetical protein